MRPYRWDPEAPTRTREKVHTSLQNVRLRAHRDARRVVMAVCRPSMAPFDTTAITRDQYRCGLSTSCLVASGPRSESAHTCSAGARVSHSESQEKAYVWTERVGLIKPVCCTFVPYHVRVTPLIGAAQRAPGEHGMRKVNNPKPTACATRRMHNGPYVVRMHRVIDPLYVTEARGSTPDYVI